MTVDRKNTILSSLQSYIPKETKDAVIESRAQHIITSAINLIEAIDKQYSKNEADLLKKKLITSIKTKSPDKFSKSVNRIKRSTNE